MTPFLLTTLPVEATDAAEHATEHAAEHEPFDMAQLILGHLFGEHGGPYAPLPGTAWLGSFAPTKMHLMMWIVAVLLLVIMSRVARHVAEERVSRGPFYHMFEAILLFLRDSVAKPVIGEEELPRFLPLIWTFFFFILFCNLLGLVPGLVTATGNIFVTATLALTAFLVFNGAGMKEHGVIGYWLGLVPHGVPWLLWPLLLVVEVIGLCAKTSALAIRLFANMVGGHATVLALLGLIFMGAGASAVLGYGIAIPVVGIVLGLYLLEILVAFIQAYIFTFLFTIFLGAALHPHH